MTQAASWVIVSRSDGMPIMEVFDHRLIDRLNVEKYRAVPIGEYLAELNSAIRMRSSDDEFRVSVWSDSP